MSLKARLKRLEAQVEWLEFDGMLRVCELKLELIDKKRQIADHLAANPEAAALFAAAGITSIRPTPRPLSPVDLVKGISSPARASEGTEGGARRAEGDSVSQQEDRYRDDYRVPLRPCGPPPPAGEAIVRPSPPEPPPLALPPKAEVWTHDPPEHMQIAPVRWRMRTAEDDWEDENDEEEDEYEYHDPLSYV